MQSIILFFVFFFFSQFSFSYETKKLSCSSATKEILAEEKLVVDGAISSNVTRKTVSSEGLNKSFLEPLRQVLKGGTIAYSDPRARECNKMVRGLHEKRRRQWSIKDQLRGLNEKFHQRDRSAELLALKEKLISEFIGLNRKIADTHIEIGEFLDAKNLKGTLFFGDCQLFENKHFEVLQTFLDGKQAEYHVAKGLGLMGSIRNLGEGDAVAGIANFDMAPSTIPAGIEFEVFSSETVSPSWLVNSGLPTGKEAKQTAINIAENSMTSFQEIVGNGHKRTAAYRSELLTQRKQVATNKGELISTDDVFPTTVIIAKEKASGQTRAVYSNPFDDDKRNLTALIQSSYDSFANSGESGISCSNGNTNVREELCSPPRSGVRLLCKAAGFSPEKQPAGKPAVHERR